MDVRGVQVHCRETQEGNEGLKKGEKVGKGTGRLSMALVARLQRTGDANFSLRSRVSSTITEGSPSRKRTQGKQATSDKWLLSGGVEFRRRPRVRDRRHS